MNVKAIFERSFLYLLGNLASRAVGLLMIPVYARFLRPSEYGALELLELCTQVTAICVGLQAVGAAMTRIYYDYSEPQKQRQVVTSALLCTALLGGLLAALVATFSAPLSRLALGSRQFGSLLTAGFAAMCLAVVVEVALVYQRIKDRAVFFVVYSLVQLIAGLVLNVYFIAFAGLGVWGFVLSKLVTSSAGVLFMLVVVLRETGWRCSLEPIRRMAAFGMPQIMVYLSFFLIHFSDRFFLKHWAGLTEVGIYAMAYKFAFLVTYLVGEPFGRVWNVSLYALAAQTEWKGQIQRIARYLMFFLFLIALALSLLIGPLMSLIASPAFKPAVRLVPVLALGYVFREIGDFFRNLLYINKRTDRVGRIAAFCAALNLALNYWLIRSCSAQGAAVATLMTWLVYLVCCWFGSESEYQLAFSWKHPVLLLTLSVGIYWLGNIPIGMPLAFQWGHSTLLLALFVTLALVCRYFPGSDRRILLQSFTRWRMGVSS